MLNGLEPPSCCVIDPPEHAAAATPGVAGFYSAGDRPDCATASRRSPTPCSTISTVKTSLRLDRQLRLSDPHRGHRRDAGNPPRGDSLSATQLAEPGAKLLTTTAAVVAGFPDRHARRCASSNDYIDTHIRAAPSQCGADDSILSARPATTAISRPSKSGCSRRLLLGAGFITTAHAFGNAVVALVGHPDQLARLLAHPEGWPNAVEETLRYDSVAQYRRSGWPPKHFESKGTPCRRARLSSFCIAGANRDPAVFERPDDFDTTRANARDHISFGTGIHVCLGAPLARMELHIGLQALFERFPHLSPRRRTDPRTTAPCCTE